MAEAVATAIGDQVRLRFIGWPAQVQAWDQSSRSIVNVNHPREGKPLIMNWNSRPYVVHPGQDIHIPFELAKKEFGDPRSLDKPQKFKPVWGDEEIIPDRPFEVNRLRAYYQNSIIEFKEYIPTERWDGPLSDMMPIVEVYTMTGERLQMVSDDPNGDTVMVESQTRSEASHLQTTVQDQADTIMELKKTNDLLLQKLGIRREDLESLNVTHTPNAVTSAAPEAPEPTEGKLLYNPRTAKVSVSETLAQRILKDNEVDEVSVDVD